MAHSSALHQTEHGSNELRLLYDIGALLCEAPDIETVLPPVLETIARYLSIHRGIITIVNRNNGEIVIEEAWGYGTGEIEKGHYQPGEGIIGRVIETGNPVAGPPDSTQRVPLKPAFTTSSRSRSSPSSRKVSRTVFCESPPKRSRVESALGSHPTTMTFRPISASAATVFCVVVDLPIPPFP